MTTADTAYIFSSIYKMSRRGSEGKRLKSVLVKKVKRSFFAHDIQELFFSFSFFPVQLAKQKPVFKYLPAPSISTASHLRAVVSLICSPGETTAYKQHANPSIYQHLKSVKSVFHLNPESLFFPSQKL